VTQKEVFIIISSDLVLKMNTQNIIIRDDEELLQSGDAERRDQAMVAPTCIWIALFIPTRRAEAKT
jgi:hypothetical protein